MKDKIINAITASIIIGATAFVLFLLTVVAIKIWQAAF